MGSGSVGLHVEVLWRGVTYYLQEVASLDGDCLFRASKHQKHQTIKWHDKFTLTGGMPIVGDDLRTRAFCIFQTINISSALTTMLIFSFHEEWRKVEKFKEVERDPSFF